MTRPTGEAAIITDGASATATGIARALAGTGLEVAILADARAVDLARVSVLCDLGGTRPATQPFVLCRWARRHVHDHDVRVLTVRPVSRLAAMGLLVPGALSARVRRTSGVARAERLGLGRPTTPADADRGDRTGHEALGREVVAALHDDHYLLASRREWECRDETAGLATTYDTRLVLA